MAKCVVCLKQIIWAKNQRTGSHCAFDAEPNPKASYIIENNAFRKATVNDPVGVRYGMHDIGCVIKRKLGIRNVYSDADKAQRAEIHRRGKPE